MYFLIAFFSPVFLNDFEYFIEFVHIRIHAVSNMVVATYFHDQFFKTAILKSSSP